MVCVILPRSNGGNGTVADYTVCISGDGIEWKAVFCRYIFCRRNGKRGFVRFSWHRVLRNRIDYLRLARKDLVVLTYNIRHGLGSDNVVDISRAADFINTINPDIVALQEVDKNVLRSGVVDQPAVLANLTGMSVEFGKGIDYEGGEYGDAILIKHPYSRIGSFPMPGSEPKEALFLEVDLSSIYGAGNTITFY